jgi:hypothetical protein
MLVFFLLMLVPIIFSGSFLEPFPVDSGDSILAIMDMFKIESVAYSRKPHLLLHPRTSRHRFGYQNSIANGPGILGVGPFVWSSAQQPQYQRNLDGNRSGDFPGASYERWNHSQNSEVGVSAQHSADRDYPDWTLASSLNRICWSARLHSSTAYKFPEIRLWGSPFNRSLLSSSQSNSLPAITLRRGELPS